MMTIATELYALQKQRWPRAGRHILAHYDDRSIIVHQAYRPSIGRFAIEHGRLGGPDFSLSRMSWIKTNFLWMMYRSGWGTKRDQEITLGLRLSLAFFESLLEQATPSTYDAAIFPDRGSWKAAVAASDVRLQWDPDHTPTGEKLERRAVQLGLCGRMLAAFASSELLEVIDMSDFVAAQRDNASGPNQAQLRTPVETIYSPDSETARRRIGSDRVFDQS